MRFETQLNFIKLFESFFLLFIVFLVMPKSAKRLSNVLIWLFILLSYVPMLTIFSLKDESRIFTYAVTAFWIAIIVLMNMPSINLALLKKSWLIKYTIFVLFGILSFLMIYRYLGLSFNLDLTKVYQIRSEISGSGNLFSGYFFNWTGKIINPLFFAIFFVKRRWVFVMLIVFLQLLLFSTTGNKIFLFALVFVCALMWSITRKNPLGVITLGITGLVLFGMITYWTVDDVWVSSLFTRRTLLDQPQQYFLYHDFFSNNSYTYLSQHRIFNIIFEYPYHLDPPHLIGEVYYGNPESNANTGIVGDAYMNIGFAGLALWSIIISLVLKAMDTFSKGKNKKIVIAAVAMTVMTLINSPLLTNFMTHGLLIVFFLLYILPQNNYSHYPTESCQ